MFLNQLFPTELWRFNSTDIDNKKLLSVILEDEQILNSVPYSNVGGWHGSDDLHLDDRYDSVVRFIHASFEEVRQHNNYIDYLTVNIPVMWSMVNRKNHFNVNHFHTKSDWSFTYYVNTPRDCGNIVFIDPRIRNTMIDHRYILKNYKNPATADIYSVTPNAGLLIMFPSYLEHHVEPNLTDEVRVCLAGNIILDVV